jgi:hypothetical protein
MSGYSTTATVESCGGSWRTGRGPALARLFSDEAQINYVANQLIVAIL